MTDPRPRRVAALVDALTVAHLDGLLALEHFCHDVAELVEVGESSSVSL